MSSPAPRPLPSRASPTREASAGPLTPNPLTNIVPTNISRLKLSGNFPMNLGIPPLQIKIVLESNPLKSTMLVGRLGVLVYNIILLQLVYYSCYMLMKVYHIIWRSLLLSNHNDNTNTTTNNANINNNQ